MEGRNRRRRMGGRGGARVGHRVAKEDQRVLRSRHGGLKRCQLDRCEDMSEHRFEEVRKVL
jgi:hypothetical protein